MTVMEFFELSVGEWICQRTSQAQGSAAPAGGKSRLEISTLSIQDPAVRQICKHHQTDPAQVVGAIRSQWTAEFEQAPKERKGEMVFVLVPDPADPQVGQLLRDPDPLGKVPLTSTYAMGSDQALTLTSQQADQSSEERIWFASPNLRLRTSLSKQGSTYRVATFCSEIRRVPSPKPAEG